MTLTKKDVLLIDATVIVGILVLLSVATISGIGNVPEKANLLAMTNATSGTRILIIESPHESTQHTVFPSYVLSPIYLVTFVTTAFVISATIEIGIILNHTRKQYWGKGKSPFEPIPLDTPERASGPSLIAMGGGFVWLSATIILYAVGAFSTILKP